MNYAMANPYSFILFLDFDGVIHVRGGDLFEHVPLLERWLRQHPACAVVISSSWREDYPMDVLVEAFAPDLQDRVLGGTPRVVEGRGCGIPFERELEIRAWLEGNDHSDTAWAALDDCAHWFEPGCAQLVACDPEIGLQHADLNALEAHVTRAHAQTTASDDAT